MSVTSTVGQKKADDQFHGLLDTVEKIRAEKFAHLDASLVRDLLRLHADGSAVDAELGRGVEQLVERQLSKEA